MEIFAKGAERATKKDSHRLRWLPFHFYFAFLSNAASMICCTLEAMLDGSGCNPSTSRALSQARSMITKTVN
jgi:hypothetical protein